MYTRRPCALRLFVFIHKSEYLLEWLMFTMQAVPWYMVVDAALLISVVIVWVCEFVLRTFIET